MCVQLDPQIRVNWIAAADEESDAEWQHVDCCAALHQPAEAPPAVDDEWWPGRCIL